MRPSQPSVKDDVVITDEAAHFSCGNPFTGKHIDKASKCFLRSSAVRFLDMDVCLFISRRTGRFPARIRVGNMESVLNHLI